MQWCGMRCRVALRLLLPSPAPPIRKQAELALFYGPMQRKASLLLVHGVDSSGDWFDTVNRTLGVHFKILPLYYTEYRFPVWHVGKLKVATGPIWAVSIAMASCVALSLIRIWLALLASAVLLLALVRIAAFIRNRSALLPTFERRLKNLTKSRSVHVVAHSFGTYLIGQAMERFPLRFRTVVLAGCVLRPDFDWVTIRQRRSSSYEAIQNFISGSDFVVRLAGWLGRIADDIGSAGVSGFLQGHNLDFPNQNCPTCTQETCRIHNIVTPAEGHSELVKSPSNVEEYFLPLLWGLPIAELEKFWKLCEDFDRDLQEYFPGKLLSLVELQTGPCRRSAADLLAPKWTPLRMGGGPMSLDAFIAEQLEIQLAEYDYVENELIGYIVCETAMVVADALGSDYEDERRRGLHPLSATLEAIRGVRMEVLDE